MSELAPMYRDFAEELSRHLNLIADSGALHGKHTAFGGEIRSMESIVRMAAKCVGRPLMDRPPVASERSEESSPRQIEPLFREDLPPSPLGREEEMDSSCASPSQPVAMRHGSSPTSEPSGKEDR